MENLKDLRSQINKVDKELIKILAKRFALTKKVGSLKKKHNLKAQDKKREFDIFKQRKIWAKKENLNPSLVEKILKLIIKEVRRNHQKIKNEKNR